MIAVVNLEQLDITWLILSLVVLFFSLSVHESAHAWAADRLGDPTGRLLGRISLNPLVHVDLIGTVLFPLIGFLAGGVIFGWAKPVPVNVSNLKDSRKSHIYVSAAGPLSNVLIALVCLVALKGLNLSVGQAALSGSLLEPLVLLFQAGLVLNIILAVFNMIPVPPLDGSWILEGVLPAQLGRIFTLIRPYGFLLLILLFYSGIIGKIIRPVLAAVYNLAF
jgi:Zn-dependent protease